MSFGVEPAAGWNFSDIHAGHALHAVKIDEASVAAHARPRCHGDIPEILDSIAVDHRNALASHPFKVRGLLKRCH
jgi:hypothetical protein